jgi:hypothetical protein
MQVLFVTVINNGTSSNGTEDDVIEIKTKTTKEGSY